MGSKIDPDFEKKMEMIKLGLKKKKATEEKIKKIENLLKERELEDSSIKTDITELKLSLYKITKDFNSLKKKLESVSDHVLGIEKIGETLKVVESLKNDTRRIETQFHAYRENMDKFLEDDKRINELREQKEREFVVKDDIKTLDEKIDKTENELGKISDIETSIENMKDDIEVLLNLRDKVSEVAGTEKSMKEFLKKMEKRIDDFEEKFSVFSNEVQNTDIKKISGMEVSIKEMKDDIDHLLILRDKIGELSGGEEGIKDFLSNIEKRMGGIENKFNTFKEDIQTVKLKKIRGIETFIRNLSKQVEELERFKDKAESDKGKEELKEQITALKWKGGELESRLDDLKSDLSEIKDLEASSQKTDKDLEKLETLIEVLKEKVGTLDERVEKNKIQIGETKTESKRDVDRHVKRLLLKIDELEKQREEIEGIKKDVESIEDVVHNFENLKKRMSEVSVQMMEHMSDKKIDDIETELKNLTEKVEKHGELSERITEVDKNFESEIADLRKNIGEMKKGGSEIDKIKKSLEVLKKEVSGVSDEISKKSEMKTKDIEDVQQSVQSLENKINSLEESVASVKSVKDAIKNIKDEISFLKSMRLDMGRIMEDITKIEEIHGYISEMDTLRKSVNEIKEKLVKTEGSFDAKLTKFNNVLSSKEEGLENAIAEIDLMRKRDIDEILDKVSILKEQVSAFQGLKETMDNKMRDQEIRILDNMIGEKEQLVKRNEIEHVFEELNNIRTDVNTLQDLVGNVEKIREEIDKKTDTGDYRALREQIRKQGKTMDEILKTFANFAKKDDVKMNEETLSMMEDKMNKLKERIKYESRMMEVLLKTFEKQREEFRTVLREQDKNIQEQGEIVEKRIDKLSELLNDAKRAMAEIGYIKNTLITRKEFIELSERVFEIEEVLKKLEIERAEILSS